MIIIRAFI